MKTVSDVMTRSVVTVNAFTPFKEIVRRMLEHRVSALPVVDEDGVLVGIVSEADLIMKEVPELGGARRFESSRRRGDRSKAAGLIATDVLTAPVVSVSPDATLGAAASLMRSHRVKRLPVVDEDKHLLGIVSRRDLLQVFLREDAEIAMDIREDVIRRTLWIEPDAIRVVVHDGVVMLEGQLERRSLIPVLEGLVSAIDGVVAIEPRLSFLQDDTSSEIPLPWTAIVPRRT